MSLSRTIGGRMIGMAATGLACLSFGGERGADVLNTVNVIRKGVRLVQQDSHGAFSPLNRADLRGRSSSSSPSSADVCPSSSWFKRSHSSRLRMDAYAAADGVDATEGVAGRPLYPPTCVTSRSRARPGCLLLPSSALLVPITGRYRSPQSSMPGG